MKISENGNDSAYEDEQEYCEKSAHDSDLNIRYFADNKIPDDLGEDGAVNHGAADLIGSQIFQVLRGSHQDEARDCDRHQNQDQTGDTSVGACRFDLAPYPKTFADDLCELTQDFSEVAAGFLLQQHGRHKEAHID